MYRRITTVGELIKFLAVNVQFDTPIYIGDVAPVVIIENGRAVVITDEEPS